MNKIKTVIGIHTKCNCCNSDIIEATKITAKEINLNSLFWKDYEIIQEKVYGKQVGFRFRLFNADRWNYKIPDPTNSEYKRYIKETTWNY